MPDMYETLLELIDPDRRPSPEPTSESNVYVCDVFPTEGMRVI